MKKKSDSDPCWLVKVILSNQLAMRDLHASNSVQSIDFKLQLHEHRRSIAAYNKCVGAQSKSPRWQRSLQPARASVSIPVELGRERTDCVHLYGFNQTAALRLSCQFANAHSIRSTSRHTVAE